MISDAVAIQIVITAGGVLTTVVSVIGIVVRSNHNQREKMQKHVDVAVDKGVEKVKLEMQRRTGSMPAFGVELAIEPTVKARPSSWSSA